LPLPWAAAGAKKRVAIVAKGYHGDRSASNRATVDKVTARSIISCMLAVFFGVGCQGNGGAISVRWRIVDLSTGVNYDPGSVKDVNGFCCCSRNSDNVCDSSNLWVIKSVSIDLSDATTGVPIADNLPSFPCSIREKTTDFVVTPGTFAMSLGAVNQIGVGLSMPAPVALPPPSVRTIIKGDVVNLDVIEIGVHPLPLPR
jgi:hypothetical protein